MTLLALLADPRLTKTKREAPSSGQPKPTIEDCLKELNIDLAKRKKDAASPSIVEAKIGDLPSHRGNILQATRSNPGIKSIALATILEKRYAVRVHNAALRKFIDRDPDDMQPQGNVLAATGQKHKSWTDIADSNQERPSHVPVQAASERSDGQIGSLFETRRKLCSMTRSIGAKSL